MTVITMSRKELTRLRVLTDIADGRLSVADATGLLEVGRRQARTRRSSQPVCAKYRRWVSARLSENFTNLG
jgi:hypothetical protein